MNQSKYHYFIYKDNNFPFLYGHAQYKSTFLWEKKNELEIQKNIKLIQDEKYEDINFPDDSIVNFIKLLNDENNYVINNDNVIFIKMLSEQFKAEALIKECDGYIEAHYNELILPILLSIQNANNIEINEYVEIISKKLMFFINDEKFLSLKVPVLYNILANYYEKYRKDEDNQNEIIDFLLEYLNRNGRKASVLFSRADFGKDPLKYLNILIRKSPNDFDFNFINSLLLKSILQKEEERNSSLAQVQNYIYSENEKLTNDCKMRIEQLIHEKQADFERISTENIQHVSSDIRDSFNNFKEETQSNLDRIILENKEKMREIEEKNSEKLDNIKNEVQEQLNAINSYIHDKNVETKRENEQLIDSKIESSINQIKTDNQNAIEEIRSSNHSYIRQINNDNNAYFDQIKTDNQKDINIIRSDNQNVIRLIKEDNQAFIAQIKNDNQDSITQIKNDNQDSITKIKEDNQAFIAQIKNDNQASINLIKTNNQASIEQIKQDNRTSIVQIKEDNQSTINNLKSSFQRDIDQYKESTKRELLGYLNHILEENGIIDQVKEEIRRNMRLEIYRVRERMDKIKEKQDEEINRLKEHNQLLVNSMKSAIIPDFTTSIEEKLFFRCEQLVEIKIPVTVVIIGNFAFAGCISLKQISIPESVTEIGDSAFLGCTALKEVNLPSSVNKLGTESFEGCKSLSRFQFSSSVIEIQKMTFCECTSLSYVSVPSSIRSIGESAFQGCTSLHNISIYYHVQIASTAFPSFTQINRLH